MIALILTVATALALLVPPGPDGVLLGMALFTSAGIATTIGATASFFTAAAAFTLNVIVGSAASFALNKLTSTLFGRREPRAVEIGFRSELALGGDVPREIMLGEGATPGHLVWHSNWGHLANEPPNTYWTLVFAFSDLPVRGLRRVFVNGEPVTLNDNPWSDGRGVSVQEYSRDGRRYMWVAFNNGSANGFNDFLANTASRPERPWSAGSVGAGVAYAIVTLRFDRQFYPQGLPRFAFELDGANLYDPSRDSTVGGAGGHRFDDPSTWGEGDGWRNPMVIAYNALRGVGYGGQWLYGFQGVTAAQMPADRWIAAIQACRDADFRAGGAVRLDAPVGDLLEELMASCEGRIADNAGAAYVPTVGFGEVVASISDDVIISTAPQSMNPFKGLSDRANGIIAKYPSPAEGWQTRTAPPRFDAAGIAADGARRLPVELSLPLVSRDEQVQRLIQAALAEAGRDRRHTLTLPPEYWGLEPGDVVAFSSARHGYEGKRFRVDAVSDLAEGDVMVSLTETDPADYHWRRQTDFTPIPDGVLGQARPPVQTTFASVEGVVVQDPGALRRRPGIRLFGAGPSDAGSVRWQVRLAGGDLVAEGEAVLDGALVNELRPFSTVIVGGLIPATDYEVRALWVVSWARPVEWSAWLAVTTPDVRLTAAEIEAGIIAEIEAVTQAAITLDGKIDDVVGELTDDLTGLEGTVNNLSQTVGGNSASITTLQGSKVDAAGAIAAIEAEVSAEFNSLSAWAGATQIAKASADKAASALVFRAVAGQGGAELAVVGWDDETGAGGAVRVQGDLLISDASIDGGVLITPNTISGDRMIANTVTAREIDVVDLLAANAFIDNLVVRTAQIEDAAITRLKVAGEAIDTARLATDAVTKPQSWSGVTVVGPAAVVTMPRAGYILAATELRILVTEGDAVVVRLRIDGATVRQRSLTLPAPNEGLPGQRVLEWSFSAQLAVAAGARTIDTMVLVNDVEVADSAGLGNASQRSREGWAVGIAA